MTNWGKFSRIVAEAKAAKKLDPVGEEDDDVDNDGDSDSSDSYLKKRRAAVGAAISADRKNKVQSDCKEELIGNQKEIDANKNGKVDAHDFALLRAKKKKGIKTEEVEQIDEVLGGQSGDGYIGHPRLGIKNPLSGPKKPTTTAPQNTGLAGRLGNRASQMDAAMKELRQSYEPEGEQIHEIPLALAAPLVVGGVGLAANAIGKGMNKFVDQQRSKKQSDYAVPAKQGGLGAITARMRSGGLESYQPEGELVDEGKADKKLPEWKRSAARTERYGNPHGSVGSGPQRDRRAEHEERRGVKKEEFVGEDREYRREMAKAAARERAEEKRSEEDYRSKGRTGKKKEGPKLSTTPNSKSAVKTYVDKASGEIAYMDKKTKGKHLHGYAFPEHVEYEIEEGMSMKDFKANRKKNERKETSTDARKRGHEGSEWHNTGRTYSPDEAKSRRAKMSDDERSARHASAVDPDNEDHSNYSADKTKDPKKLRKQKAMGEGYLAEKSLSRAQQRFFGMVRAEQKGEMKDASPEVKEAAKSMKEKDVHDFASTKHKGLPEKKSDCKEEMSLVERILAEATDAERMAAKARREEREKKQSKRLRAAKLSVAANKALRGEEEEDQPKRKRGKSAPTATERSATISAAGRVKSAEKEGKYKVEAEKIKSERQRERFAREEEKKKEKAAEREEKAKERQEDLESKQKEKKIKAAQLESDRKTARKEKTKDEIRGALKSAAKSVKFPSPVSDREKGSTGKTIDQFGDTIGSVVGAVGKAGRGILAAKMKERKEKKQEQERQQRHEKIRKGMSEDIFSNWREEFILEVDDQNLAANPKVIDVSKKKNKIEINPNMSEECGCDRKETPKKDMRDLPTKVNLAKTKLRSAGVRNPVVMVTSEENIQEIAPLVGVLARVAGGAAARGITSRVAGSAAQGTLRSKAAELLGKKAGQMTAQSVQDKLTPKFKDEPEIGSEPYYMTNLEKKLRNEDWQSVNRKDKTDGLSQKAVNAYRRENPGSKLQTAVTEKNPEGKRASRRKSFCSRMGGMKSKLTSSKTANDPDSRINKALRRWNCN